MLRATKPPTLAIGVRGDENGPEDQRAREVIDLVLRLGETLLATGSSASDVTSTILRLTRAYTVRSVNVDVTYTSLTVSYHRGPYRDPVTVMRVVPTMAADYTRLEGLQALVRDIVEEGLDLPDARERLDEIVAAHHPYRRSVVTLSMALLGGAVAALLGGGIVLILLAAGTAALVDRLQRSLSLHGLPAFFSQAVGAVVPTVVALLLWAVAARSDYEIPVSLTPSIIVATGVVVLLAGLSVVSSAQDTIDGYYVTAGGRAFEVLILSSGIAVGVLATLAIGQRLGVPLHVNPNIGFAGNLVVETVAAGVVAAAYAVASYTGMRGIAFSTAIGAFGWVLFRLGMQLFDMSPVTSTAVAACAVGALAQTIASPFRVPALALSTAGIVPLLPGLAVFRGILDLVDPGGTADAGTTTLITAAATGMAIAAGVSLGSLPIRRLRADRVQRRLLRRAAADPRE